MGKTNFEMMLNSSRRREEESDLDPGLCHEEPGVKEVRSVSTNQRPALGKLTNHRPAPTQDTGANF